MFRPCRGAAIAGRAKASRSCRAYPRRRTTGAVGALMSDAAKAAQAECVGRRNHPPLAGQEEMRHTWERHGPNRAVASGREAVVGPASEAFPGETGIRQCRQVIIGIGGRWPITPDANTMVVHGEPTA